MKLPWRIEWTTYGESMGTNSRSRIVDADGKHVVTVGYGSQKQVHEAERIADLICSKVNGPATAGCAVREQVQV
jgi:hypothetical protein